MTNVPIVRLQHAADLPLPAYQTAGSAGCDLRAACVGEIDIPPLGRALIPTGLALALPEGLEAQVRPRSGLAAREGVTVLNSPGTIDSDYRGEIKVILVNLSDRAVQIARGDRIAQLIVAPIRQVTWTEVDDLEQTHRGSGGFGSTGR